MTKSHKKALFITYFFPPSGESGMQRALKFVKYLPEHGWKPVVLTVRERHYKNNRMDYSSLREVPDSVNVYRTNTKYLLSVIHKISQLIPKKEISGKPVNLITSGITQASFRENVKNFLTDLLTIPDQHIGWLPYALFEGIRVIDREKPDVIFSTSPPVVTHLIALILKSLFGIPWVADFRDPWIAYMPGMQKMSKVKRDISVRLEKEIMGKADIVIANTEPLRQQFHKRYGISFPLSKFITLPNGYDKTDIQGFGNLSHNQNGKFVISHTGEFYDDIRTPDNFMIALSQLIMENMIAKNEVKVNLVGGGDYSKSDHFNRLLKNLGLNEVINTVDFVPHRECIEYLHNSTALLLLQTSPMANLQIPAKAFEYIGLCKPILAVTPVDGATSGLIKHSRTGIVVNPEEPKSIMQGILNLYQEYKNHELDKYKNDQTMQEYSREKLTETLSELFNVITARRGG